MKKQTEQKQEQTEKKERFSVYIYPKTMELARKWCAEDNCASTSEFIEKAISFYSGYVSSGQNTDFFPRAVISTLKAIVRESEERQYSQLYRVAVELSVLMNVLAASNGFAGKDVRALRESCEEEVKRLNGTLRVEDAVRWQNS
ncbi:MAG: hypothetical protein J5885_04195 [Clostridia bacterium]|nr:hypothetical protein [Clostridia bacterium]